MLDLFELGYWRTEDFWENGTSVNHIKALIGFGEEESKEAGSYYYLNKLGDSINCKVILRRDNGEVVVINENGCQVCLTENDLYEK